MNDYLIGIEAILWIFGPVLIFFGLLALGEYLDKRDDDQKLRDQLMGRTYND